MRQVRPDGTILDTNAPSGGGVTDHGALSGLADDDHAQYHTDARGDARYSQLGHTHSAGDVTSGSLAQARQSILAAGAYLMLPWEQYPAGNVSCTAPSANAVSVVAFTPRATISVLSIHMDVQVLFSGGLCSVGVYSANGNAKLIDSGTKSTAATGAQSTTLGAAVTLYANTLYWLAYTHDNTTSAIRGIVAALTGATNVLNAGAVQVGTAATAATAGALPSTLGAITGASRPIPMIKAQG